MEAVLRRRRKKEQERGVENGNRSYLVAMGVSIELGSDDVFILNDKFEIPIREGRRKKWREGRREGEREGGRRYS